MKNLRIYSNCHCFFSIGSSRAHLILAQFASFSIRFLWPNASKTYPHRLANNLGLIVPFYSTEPCACTNAFLVMQLLDTLSFSISFSRPILRKHFGQNPCYAVCFAFSARQQNLYFEFTLHLVGHPMKSTRPSSPQIDPISI